MGSDLDPRLTFDTFVVGAANRLASAAARRAAESPGASYNPLFLYSASGLGKSHILSAVASYSARYSPDRVVVYQTLEGYLDELTEALERGMQEAMRERYVALDTLLLDDVQFLTGQNQAQEMLLRTLDALTGRGAQVVLASDRPPAEINGLDARLLSRFSGGLIVDIGPPDYETRVAIIRRKAEEREMELSPGVAEALARFPLKNVRELQGALNRLLAVQELEERAVTAEDLPELMGDRMEPVAGELPESPSPGSDTLSPSDVPGSAPTEDVPAWQKELQAAVAAAGEEGFNAGRLEGFLADAGDEGEPDGWGDVLEQFRTDLDRLRSLRAELDELGNPWPEASATLLRDPERLEEAESLLHSARERARPFPEVPPGPALAGLEAELTPLAVRAADRLVRAERPDYNPLYVHSTEPDRTGKLLEATGRTLLEVAPDATMGLISVPEFAEEFIRAISDGVAGAWRERWWSVDLLLLREVEALSSTERAQEEFFHLFEALKRRGSRILLAADRPPSGIDGVDERLRSRFEGGLVVDLGSGSGAEAGHAQSPAAPTAAEAPDQAPDQAPSDEPDPGPAEVAPGTDDGDLSDPDPMQGFDDGDDLRAVRELAGVNRTAGSDASGNGEGTPAAAGTSSTGSTEEERWNPRPDRVVWDWPRPAERVAEDQE